MLNVYLNLYYKYLDIINLDFQHVGLSLIKYCLEDAAIARQIRLLIWLKKVLLG